MKYIRISSQGLIDEKAFTLIGASSKRDDKTKIGFFGSGLKYSIAFLIRNNIDFKVYSDFKEITFGKEEQDFRDKKFHVITVNGEKTSMTTDMGIDWEAWFIIREIYCNALDEGQSEIRVINPDLENGNKVVPMEGKTVFYLAAEPFKEVVEKWGEYFSEGREDLVVTEKGIKYYRPTPEHVVIYRKGIRCESIKEKSVFDYDCEWIEINESRVIKSEWDFKYKLTEYLSRSESPEVVTQLLAMINDRWEKSLFWNYSYSHFSDLWKDCVKDRTLVPNEQTGFWHDIIKESPESYLILPSVLCKSLKDKFGKGVRLIGEEVTGSSDIQFREIVPSDRMSNMLISANEFFKKANYTLSAPIKVGRFAAPEKMGQASKELIMISEKVFDKGMKYVVSTIMEENEHIVSGYGDETRAFQNHIFERWITSIEDLTKKYL